MEQRTRLSAPERRIQLLSVAGALFAEHGFHGLSMEQLAEAAGVSKPVLYQHFPSKRDLYLALVRDAVARLEQRVRAALDGTTNNRSRVHGAISAYFDFVEDPSFGLLFDTADIGDIDVRSEVEGAMRRVGEAVGALIAEDAGLTPQAAHFLAATLRGAATEGARWWVEHPEVGKEEAVALLAMLAWRGLGSFGPQNSPGDTR